MHRQLTEREKQILLMIRPTNFQDIVEEVRKYYDDMRYARKNLMILNDT